MAQIGIPNHAAFLDDSYLWTELDQLNKLQQAVTITETWDALKSVAWAFSGTARKVVADAFFLAFLA